MGWKVVDNRIKHQLDLVLKAEPHNTGKNSIVDGCFYGYQLSISLRFPSPFKRIIINFISFSNCFNYFSRYSFELGQGIQLLEYLLSRYSPDLAFILIKSMIPSSEPIILNWVCVRLKTIRKVCLIPE